MNSSGKEIQRISQPMLSHYASIADSFWEGTRDHDVSQNIQSLLAALTPLGEGPYRLLDFGCGPGRDLKALRALGHQPVGLDGVAPFVEMARNYSECEVWLQDFLDLDLPPDRFDGVFANASLFHIPSESLPTALRRLYDTLVSGGVLFASNPRGANQEGWSGERYCCWRELEHWTPILEEAGFRMVEHYYRPQGKPPEEQPWLAMVWRKEV